MSVNNTPVEGVERALDITGSPPVRQQVPRQAPNHLTGKIGYLQVTIG